MPLKTNTLVQYPFYKGHDPNKWKYIHKWDSQSWIKDRYITTINNEEKQQYDIVSGKGIVVIESS